jgi:hypothetical protein
MRGRRPSEKSKYYLPPRQYAFAVSYALMRDEWAAEIKSLRNQSKAIRYDKARVQISSGYNATEAAAVEILELQSKIEKIDSSIREAIEELDHPEMIAQYIKLAVCNGFTFTQLTTGRHRMPFNCNKFGLIKHKFYYILSTKI